ncbi:MAG TPA: tRNA uridine-5-carboxymethylaminomethyl(34) synthesis GTPase MnmE [Firmicutes bacterium]|nr:tRNA uridine-5-carboxymethylaminomethyl(34) synthesis GTPase MnmE [Bacillota bacterium]
MIESTIAAVATPLGEGGIGIVRLSGPEALRIADQIFRGKKGEKLSEIGTYQLRYGKVVDPHTGQMVDEALALVMRAPHSYTAEDVVELQCHGGVVVVQEILSLSLMLGAQAAEPGEFTKRAFLNGRLDLSQAEAVIDIVRSQTRLGLLVAVDQLEGSLSKRIKALQERLYAITAQVEASIDFPEDDLPDVELREIEHSLELSIQELGTLLATADEGKILREGLKTVITGKPNVGKSSLLNTLLNENRALVTNVPGTTRDSIEEVVNLRGIPLRLIDTAGIRESTDLVEQLGVARSLDLLQQADLVLHVLDRSEALTEEDFEVLRRTRNAKRIVLINKVDLAPVWAMEDLGDVGGSPVLEISLLGDNPGVIQDLADTILHLVGSGQIQRSAGSRAVVTRTRHKQALQKAKGSLQESLGTLHAGLPLDLIAVDLYAALEHLGEITGETVRDNVLERIFAQFCIGK